MSSSSRAGRNDQWTALLLLGTKQPWRFLLLLLRHQFLCSFIIWISELPLTENIIRIS